MWSWRVNVFLICKFNGGEGWYSYLYCTAKVTLAWETWGFYVGTR